MFTYKYRTMFGLQEVLNKYLLTFLFSEALLEFCLFLVGSGCISLKGQFYSQDPAESCSVQKRETYQSHMEELIIYPLQLGTVNEILKQEENPIQHSFTCELLI